MRIAVIGAGKAGTAVAVAWSRSGHAITAVAGRAATAERAATWLPGVPVLPVDETARSGEALVLAVPDDAITGAAAAVAGVIEPGTWVLHLSGAAGLEVLDPIVGSGGRRLALHPLQTFADVTGAVAALDGSTVAVTGDDEEGFALGERLARDLGGVPFRLADAMRPRYHAAAVFASNYLVTVSGAAALVFASAGVPDPLTAMAPLQDATLANVHRLGPQAALTGPAVRGDAGTIARNLAALHPTTPQLVAPYVALCRTAMDVAGDRLATADRAAIEEVLTRWT